MNRGDSQLSESTDTGEAILAIVRNGELSLTDLFECLKVQGLNDEAVIRSTTTRLLAENRIEMTPQRHLKMVASRARHR